MPFNLVSSNRTNLAITTRAILAKLGKKGTEEVVKTGKHEIHRNFFFCDYPAVPVRFKQARNRCLTLGLVLCLPGSGAFGCRVSEYQAGGQQSGC